jgi:hypothetical protein
MSFFWISFRMKADIPGVHERTDRLEPQAFDAFLDLLQRAFLPP